MVPVNNVKYGVALLCAVMSLTACTVGPDYVRPKVATPVAFKESEGWKVAQPKDNINRGAWWEIFNDPKLNELEQQVEISNQNLAAAEGSVQAGAADIELARLSAQAALAQDYLQLRIRDELKDLLDTTGHIPDLSGPDKEPLCRRRSVQVRCTPGRNATQSSPGAGRGNRCSASPV